jgi:hypothetical protein
MPNAQGGTGTHATIDRLEFFLNRPVGIVSGNNPKFNFSAMEFNSFFVELNRT